MTERIKFGSKDAADRIREQHAEHLCVDDDKRLKTVAFSSDTPESLLQRIEAEATEDRAVDRERSNTAELTDRERNRISDLDGFDRTTTTLSWASAKGVFEREGLGDQFWDAMGYLTDYDDPAEGAEQYVAEYQERGSGGGSRDVGEEDITGAQREANAAAREQAEGCDHAHDVCRNGEPEACEFLADACGYDEEEVDQLLGAEEDDPADADPDEITGEAAGALSRSWNGYKGAIAAFGDALDQAAEAWKHANQAAEAINGIRDRHGQGPLHFDALEVANADLLDLTRKAAADCVECHADHSEHDHAVDADALEDLRKFVDEGAPATPVGTSDTKDRPTDAELAERAPERPPAKGQDTDPKGPAAPIDTSPNHDPAGYPDTPESVYYRGTPVSPFDMESNVRDDRRAISPRDDQRDQRRHREQLDTIAAADATADEETPNGSEQFANEQQGTLGVDVDADQAAEEKQVTLGGADASDTTGALPAAWRREGSTWVAGPFRVQLDSPNGSRWSVRLYGPDHRFDVATDIRTAQQAEAIAEGFTDRVAPDAVSFHSNDSTVPEAAAEAKADATPDSGGLTEYT
ncbi:hypothetical protein GJ633_04135 [Halorubrum sp. CBA1125]|uniref:hypothetical protein n=1 Tax=Halorubrum sp. CBA1125 TaxID=2668072 RepID=UPI0012E8CD3D|nr:hypothetical protein [Halorubrum sp. CBA1125]MUW13941.1 hypothetical protein [Halorubrum sp. CBA1125]